MFDVTKLDLVGKVLLVQKNGQINNIDSVDDCFELIQEKNYFTLSDSFVIVDLDKYVPKEMMRFIFEREQEKGGGKAIFYIGGLFLLLIVIITIVYFTVIKKDNVDILLNSNISNIVDREDYNIPVKQDDVVLKVNPVIKDFPSVNEYSNGIINLETPVVENIISDDNSKQLLFDLDSCNNTNGLILSDYENLKIDYNYLKDENKSLINKNDLLNIKLDNLSNVISGNITNLEDYFGVMLYRACSNREDLNCNRLFYYFYNGFDE